MTSYVSDKDTESQQGEDAAEVAGALPAEPRAAGAPASACYRLACVPNIRVELCNPQDLQM